VKRCPKRALWVLACVGLLSVFSCASAAQPKGGRFAEPPLAEPTEFTNVFVMGYFGEYMPMTKAKFEQVLIHAKKSGYNTIYCSYYDWRLELCRKHGMKMMIDFVRLGRDLFFCPTWAEKVCRKLRGDSAVWGYAISHDALRAGGAWFDPMITKLREWDPTHPIWLGCYRAYGIAQVGVSPGVFAWYDYHWARGHVHHFFNLMYYWRLTQGRGEGHTGRWILFTNYNRDLYTLNTSIACGLKVSLWFMCNQWNGETWTDGHHKKVNAEVRLMYKELMKIGRPVAVYTTPTTKDPGNRDKAKGLPWRGWVKIPDDHWVQVRSGEVILGMYKYKDGTDAIYVANHNAYAGQKMILEFKSDKKLNVDMFDRKKGGWTKMKLEGKKLSFDLAPAGGELLRITGRGGK